MEKLLQKSGKDVARIFVIRLGFLAVLLLAFLWEPVGLPTLATSRYYNALISFGSIAIVILWAAEITTIFGKTITNGGGKTEQSYGEENRPSGILINILIVILTVFVILFELPPPPKLFP